MFTAASITLHVIILGVLLVITGWMMLLGIIRLIHRFCPSALPFLPFALTIIAAKAVISLL